MNKKTARRHKPKSAKKNDNRRDPRYASVRAWDWRLCLDCDTLVSERCPFCGGDNFTKSPGAIIRTGIRTYGYPPSLHQA
jgi:hypothetical protein